MTAMIRNLASAGLLLAVASGCAALRAAPPSPELASRGSILFQDDFSGRLGGWDRLKASEGIMDYDSGGFRIVVNQVETNFWTSPRKSYADAQVEVDAAKLAGPDENRIGLICRRTGDRYYFFMVTSDGYYGIGLFSDGLASLLGQSQLEFNDRILTGMAVNHLSAECAGDRLSLEVNGVPLASVSDSSLTSGDVGLLAGTFGEGGTDIIFDNFIVRAP